MPARIQTSLTRLLNIRVPVVCAPMAGAAGGLLAAGVARGGGFGFVAAGHQPLSHLLSEISLARTSLDLPDSSPLPFGIGLLLWRLEGPHGDPALAPSFLEAILDARPAGIWLAFGAELRSWVERIREMERARGEGRTNLFVMIGTVEQGVEVAGLTIDAGTESGGHGPTTAVGLPLLSLLPLLLPHYSTPTSPLLLPAGGLTSGTHLASLLAFSPGIIVGTAFLLTPEALFLPAQKELLKTSTGEETVRTRRFDEARGTLGWGEGVDGRGVRNWTSEREGGGGREEYEVAVKEGDVTRIVTWAGTGVGSCREIKPAEELVQDMEREALEVLGRMKEVVVV